MAAALSPEQEQNLQIPQRLQYLFNRTDCNPDKVLLAAILTSFFAIILFFALSSFQFILALVFTVLSIVMAFHGYGIGPLCHHQREQCFIPQCLQNILTKIPANYRLESWVYFAILAIITLLILTLSLSSIKLLFVLCFSALCTIMALKVYELGPLGNPNLMA